MKRKQRPSYTEYVACFEALGLKPLSHKQWWAAVRHAE